MFSNKFLTVCLFSLLVVLPSGVLIAAGTLDLRSDMAAGVGGGAGESRWIVDYQVPLIGLASRSLDFGSRVDLSRVAGNTFQRFRLNAKYISKINDRFIIALFPQLKLFQSTEYSTATNMLTGMKGDLNYEWTDRTRLNLHTRYDLANYGNFTDWSYSQAVIRGELVHIVNEYRDELSLIADHNRYNKRDSAGRFSLNKFGVAYKFNLSPWMKFTLNDNYQIKTYDESTGDSYQQNTLRGELNSRMGQDQYLQFSTKLIDTTFQTEVTQNSQIVDLRGSFFQRISSGLNWTLRPGFVNSTGGNASANYSCLQYGQTLSWIIVPGQEINLDLDWFNWDYANNAHDLSQSIISSRWQIIVPERNLLYTDIRYTIHYYPSNTNSFNQYAFETGLRIDLLDWLRIKNSVQIEERIYTNTVMRTNNYVGYYLLMDAEVAYLPEWPISVQLLYRHRLSDLEVYGIRVGASYAID